MSANIASCAVTGQNLACFVAGRRPARRSRRSQLARNAAQNRSDEDQSPAQKVAAAGLAAILLASQSQAASAKNEVAVASQDDLLTELLQKNGGKGVKIIRAPKKKEESAQETPSPYNAAPAPAPGPASKKATPSASQQAPFKLPAADKVTFSGPVKSGTQGEYPKGYEGVKTIGPKAKGAAKSAASSAKDAVQSAVRSNPLQPKQAEQKPSAPKPSFKNPLLERREAEDAAKRAASAVKDAVPDLPKVELPNPFKQSAPEKLPAAPKPAFKNPLAERRDAEAAAKKAASAVKEAVPEPPKIGLPNFFEQKPKLPEAPSAPKPAFKNPLLERRDAEAAAKKAASAVKDAAPEAPKISLPNLFEQKPEVPKAPSVPKPAFKNPLLEKRDAESAAKKAISAVKDAVPDVPKVELPNIFEQKPKLPDVPAAAKSAFKNPLLEKREAEQAAQKAVSVVKDAVPDAPKIELPKLFEQKPELPDLPAAAKPAFKNPLLEKREAEQAAQKAVSAVKDAVPDTPKVELPNIFEQKPELPDLPAVAKSAFKNPLLEKREAEQAAQKAASAVKDAVPDTPKVQLPNLFEEKPELPLPALPEKPAFENPLLAKRKAEDALKSAASSASKAVQEASSSGNPLGAAAGAATGAAGAAATAASSATSGVTTPSLPSISLPSLPSLGSRTANDTKEAVGVLGAEVAAALLVSSVVGGITADVPRKKELNR